MSNRVGAAALITCNVVSIPVIVTLHQLVPDDVARVLSIAAACVACPLLAGLAGDRALRKRR